MKIIDYKLQRIGLTHLLNNLANLTFKNDIWKDDVMAKIKNWTPADHMEGGVTKAAWTHDRINTSVRVHKSVKPKPRNYKYIVLLMPDVLKMREPIYKGNNLRKTKKVARHWMKSHPLKNVQWTIESDDESSDIDYSKPKNMTPRNRRKYHNKQQAAYES
jgi:hypothetical protein